MQLSRRDSNQKTARADLKIFRGVSEDEYITKAKEFETEEFEAKESKETSGTDKGTKNIDRVESTGIVSRCPNATRRIATPTVETEL